MTSTNPERKLRKTLKLAEKNLKICQETACFWQKFCQSFAKVLPETFQKLFHSQVSQGFLRVFSGFSQVLAVLAKVLAKLVEVLPEPKPNDIRVFESFLANWQNFPYIVSKKT